LSSLASAVHSKKKGTLFQSSLKLPIYIHQHLFFQNSARLMRIIVIIVCVSDVFHLYLIYCYEKEVSSGVIVNRNIFFPSLRAEGEAIHLYRLPRRPAGSSQ